LIVNLSGVTCSRNSLHGAYFHLSQVGNTIPPIVIGTELSLRADNCTFDGNGFANNGIQIREGSGLAVHVEQGRMVGPNSFPLFFPPSLIANSDFFGNAAHGLHLRGGDDSQVTYGAAIEGVVPNNVLDNNGFPSFPGLNLPSWELLVEVGDADNTAAVFSRVAVTQNTICDALEEPNPLSDFLATSASLFGTGHQLSAFVGNLGLQSLFDSSGQMFQGLLVPTTPASVTDNCGPFCGANEN
jgi:hypothetical protein